MSYYMIHVLLVDKQFDTKKLLKDKIQELRNDDHEEIKKKEKEINRRLGKKQSMTVENLKVEIDECKGDKRICCSEGFNFLIKLSEFKYWIMDKKEKK